MAQRISARTLLLFSLACGLLALPSCRSTNQLLKAKPARLSAFVQHGSEMVDPRKKLPFHKLWKSPDVESWERAEKKTAIYIAPVSLDYLRSIDKALVSGEVTIGTLDRKEDEIAAYMQEVFVEAFQKSPKARYKVATQPGEDTVTLQLALVELNPTSAKGNAVLNTLNFFFGPLVYIGAVFTKGNIAFEGRLSNSTTGEAIVEFADNEEDPMTIYSVRDFVSYGHAKRAIRNWAVQFELYTRNRTGKKIRESAFITLNPF